MSVKPLFFGVVQCATDEDLVARSGHRMVVDKGNLYCWGGYNPHYWGVENTEDTEYPLFKELWRFNIWSKKWQKLHTTGTVPKELASHYIIKIGNHILHFGGTAVPFGITSTSRLYDLDLHSLEWKPCRVSGDIPTEKYGHTLTLVDRYIYSIGGTTGFVYNMDVHRFDLTTCTWKLVKPESKYIPEPSPVLKQWGYIGFASSVIPYQLIEFMWLQDMDSLDVFEWEIHRSAYYMWLNGYRHEVVYYDRKLFMFGGGTGVTAHSLDKVDIFDVDTRKWQSVITKPCGSDSEFPAARKCHSCTKFREDMYLCGGLTGGTLEESRIHGDVWKFHLPSNQWTRLKTVLQIPVYFHTADVTPEGCLYVFGGVTHVDDERTSDLQKLWLCVPSLITLSWCAITNFANTESLVQNKQSVIHLGIPSYLLDLLS